MLRVGVTACVYFEWERADPLVPLESKERMRLNVEVLIMGNFLLVVSIVLHLGTSRK